jgi:membrane-associated phospholipid phosphatase
MLIELSAQYLYLVVIAGACLTAVLLPRTAQKRLALLAVLVFPGSFIVGTLLGMVISSPRPFVVEPIPPLIPASTDNGFPSDHTLLAMACATVIFVFSRRTGVILIALALVVGAARVAARVHHPIDVLGSAAIVWAVTLAVWWLLATVVRRPQPDGTAGELSSTS